MRLRQYIDKYQIEGADIDCAARIHLCQARCCSFTFPLSPQDLDEGGVRWDVEDPYMIRHDEDGYCSHLDRGTLGCTIHQRRPATCRQYDCRQDPRVWVDFEARVPAPQLWRARSPRLTSSVRVRVARPSRARASSESSV